jgi:hypothetical protein
MSKKDSLRSTNYTEYKETAMFQDSFALLTSNSSSLPLFTHVICLQGSNIPERKLSHHSGVIVRELNIVQN